MAYMNKEKKALIAAELKRVLPKSWKYSLTTTDSSITLAITEAPMDLIGLSLPCPSFAGRAQCWSTDINVYYLSDRYVGEALGLMSAAVDALNTGNWDRSDSMTDYFNVGHYVHFCLGTPAKPFNHVKALAAEEARQPRELTGPAAPKRAKPRASLSL